MGVNWVFNNIQSLIVYFKDCNQASSGITNLFSGELFSVPSTCTCTMSINEVIYGVFIRCLLQAINSYLTTATGCIWLSVYWQKTQSGQWLASVDSWGSQCVQSGHSAFTMLPVNTQVHLTWGQLLLCRVDIKSRFRKFRGKFAQFHKTPKKYIPKMCVHRPPQTVILNRKCS